MLFPHLSLFFSIALNTIQNPIYLFPIFFHWIFFNWRIITLQNWVGFCCSVQSLSHVRLFAAPWIAAHQAFLSITNSQSLLKAMSIEPVMPSSHLILCRPLLLLPPIPPSIRVFSSESTLCMRWPEYWSFSFSISPSNEHPGLISFRIGPPCSTRDSRVFSNTTIQKHQFFSTQLSSHLSHPSLWWIHPCPTLTSIHDHWKNHSLD